MSSQQNRRNFLQSTAAIGAGYWVAERTSPVFSRSPNEQIQFASIGVGGKGSSDSKNAARHGKMVAICDVDERTLKRAAVGFKADGHDPKQFFDFRTMLDEMGDKIDAVTVSTPDHVHAVAAAMAMNMGKHCFVQKPLTHSIYEARVLGELAREKGVATQMGNQGTANNPLREAAAVLRSGALGTIKEVHVWTNRPIWPTLSERLPGKPIPPYLHWQEWLGPAPERDYNPGYHPKSWRGFWDFGTGALGDMACHTVNMPFAGLKLSNPTSVEAEHAGHNKDSYPGWSVIKYEFPANDQREALTMTWYDGGKRPPLDMLEGEKPKENSGGVVIEGTRGKLVSIGDYAGQVNYYHMDKPKVEYEKSPGHFDEWVIAINGGSSAKSNFPDYAGPLTETILLGNLAIWANKRVEWDAEMVRATNAPELESFVRRPYREGYSLGYEPKSLRVEKAAAAG